MSQLGLITGSIALIEKSLALFRAINAAKNFGSDAAQSVMMLRFEAFRYERWASNNRDVADMFTSHPAANPTPASSTFAATAVRASPSTSISKIICDTIVQVIDILEDIDKLLSKYGRAFEAAQVPSSRKSVAHAVGTVASVVSPRGTNKGMFQANKDFRRLEDSLQSKTSFPRRFAHGIQTWTEPDKDVLRSLVHRFKYWNDALNELTSPAKREIIDLEVTSRIIGSAGALEQLQNIQSAAEESDYESIQRSAQAKFEKLNRQGEIETIEKNYGDLRIDSPAAKSRRFMTEYYPKDKDDSTEAIKPQTVIAEWFYYDSKWEEKHVELANHRIEALAHDFSAIKKPRRLTVLDCIGWVQHPTKPDRALLYSLPSSIPSGPSSLAPVSLLEVLSGSATTGQGSRRPSLAERFRLSLTLAVSFLELHTIEWLHKSFNSQNVLLFRNPDGAIGYTKPFIVGFDFARPDRPGEISLSTRSTQFDLYRHPDIRLPRRSFSDAKSFFRKRHDIYSLGLVLFEIGVWSRLDRYTKPNLDPEAFRKRIRDYVDKDLSLFMGDHFRHAVDACLSGQYAHAMKTISLDGEVLEDDDELAQPEDLTHSPDEANSTELDGFCRCVLAELNLCHCDVGSALHK